MNPRRHFSDDQAIEARLSARLGAGLTERTEQLPHEIVERLRAAREQALARAAEVRRRSPQGSAAGETAVVGLSTQGAALLGGLGGAPAWWQRAASLLPLAVLVLGLMLIQRQSELEQIHAAAEVDTQLLADDLPPDAYSDPGFAEFMRERAP
ncbi:MAG: DUF3619 family protein [Rubrivivax sp.]